MLRRIGRWLWVLATACSMVGMYGLADLREAGPVYKLVLLMPHIAGVALVVWAGRRKLAAGLVAFVGSASMAGLSWADALDRQTEGLEWRFNNALSGVMFCGANYVTLSVFGWLVLFLVNPTEGAGPGSGGRGEQGEACSP